jgi:anti-sigma-K factor RskA
MAATPVDDHTEDFEQLAGLSALHALEGEELERFEAHAAHCERCRMTVRLDREALSNLSLAAPEMEPSPDFKARLMQRAAQELAERTSAESSAGTAPSPQREPTPLRPTGVSTTPPAVEAGDRRSTPIRTPANVIPIWRRRSPWLNAIAAVAVLAALSFGAYSYENQPVATIQISGSGPGSATVVVRRSGAAEIQMQGVPDPGPGFIYEAWVIPAGNEPIAAGTATSGNASISLERDPRGATVAITRERSRVSAPTPPILMSGEVRL